jgi:hypothetical protein
MLISVKYGLIPGSYKDKDEDEIVVSNHLELQYCGSCRERGVLEGQALLGYFCRYLAINFPVQV